MDSKKDNGGFEMNEIELTKLFVEYKETTNKPLKLPKFWVAVFFDGEEYHFCSIKCAISFLSSTVLSEPTKD